MRVNGNSKENGIESILMDCICFLWLWIFLTGYYRMRGFRASFFFLIFVWTSLNELDQDMAFVAYMQTKSWILIEKTVGDERKLWIFMREIKKYMFKIWRNEELWLI